MKLSIVIIALLLLSTNAYALSWSDAYASPTSGTQYSPERSYDFRITWNGDGKLISGVLFELTNHSSGTIVNSTVSNVMNLYFINFTGLFPTDYSYRWFAVDNESNTNVTDYFPYSVTKNTSAAFSLYLNGTEGNRSYSKNTAANFTAKLNIPGKTVFLDSDYPGLDVQNDSSVIYALANLTYEGVFVLNASWNGDDFYNAAWKAFYFDSTPPQYYNINTNPLDYATYAPNQSYYFNISWTDVTLTEVRFESNHTGSKKNYTTSTNPKVYNQSGTFWINLTDIFPANFVYRWYAKDDSGSWTGTEQRSYRLFKAFALNLYAPFDEILNGTTSVVNCWSLTDQISIKNFDFHRNSTKIENTSMSERMDVSMLPVGYYEYICKTDGNKNYTNQTLRKNLTVVTEYKKKPTEAKKEFKITDVSSVYVKLGQSAEGTFNLSSTLDETVTNFEVVVENVQTSWYSVKGVPSALLKGGYVIIKINFDIPSESNPEYIDVLIKVNGKTANGTVSATGKMPLSINKAEPAANQPPSYYDFSSSPVKEDEPVVFSFVLSDDRGLSGYIFSMNDTGSWVNDSWISLEGTDGSIDVMKDAVNNAYGVVAWKVYSNDTNGAWSESRENFMEIRSEVGLDYTVPLIIVIVAIIAAVVVFLMYKDQPRRTHKVVYVYTKDG
ncbi:MAG: hypothetical protein V1818_00360 [Candidatus Aenigmatarchaeota archaeon]